MSVGLDLSCDVIVVGGGMAGVSLGYELARDHEVVVVEQEAQLAYHTTGRSAALYLPSYGNQLVRALTVASREDFGRVERDFSTAPLLSPRQMLWIAAPGDLEQLQLLVEDLPPTAEVQMVAPNDARKVFPALRTEAVAGAAIEDGIADIDVAALHQAYVQGLARRGATVVRDEPVRSLAVSGGTWSATTPARTVVAPTVVDACGAWADELAALAGVRPIGLQPLRRTLFTTPARWPEEISRWPWLSDVADRFYLKPEHDQLLVSPADETPSEPCDARPAEQDVARALELVGEYTLFEARSVRSAWAGLRSFVPDRSPVVGARPSEPGFFWFAGQGGYGIQMAPALARAAGAVVRGEPLPEDLRALGVQAGQFSPARLEVASGPAGGPATA